MSKVTSKVHNMTLEGKVQPSQSKTMNTTLQMTKDKAETRNVLKTPCQIRQSHRMQSLPQTLSPIKLSRKPPIENRSVKHHHSQRRFRPHGCRPLQKTRFDRKRDPNLKDEQFCEVGHATSYGRRCRNPEKMPSPHRFWCKIFPVLGGLFANFLDFGVSFGHFCRVFS